MLYGLRPIKEVMGRNLIDQGKEMAKALALRSIGHRDSLTKLLESAYGLANRYHAYPRRPLFIAALWLERIDRQVVRA